MTELHDLLWRWRDICRAECNTVQGRGWEPVPIYEAEFV